ncbi:MAG TPA: hypothetical protein VMD51_07450, partial [Mycobacterium sp.]|nr:hypothetical protein [Mycobacterium sp.]
RMMILGLPSGAGGGELSPAAIGSSRVSVPDHTGAASRPADQISSPARRAGAVRRPINGWLGAPR